MRWKLLTTHLLALQIQPKEKRILLLIPPHSGGFYPEYGHFCPAFGDKIDESFLRFFSLTLVLLDSILLLEVQFRKMNETTEKCSPARYARTFKKVAIFLVKSDTVH